MYIDKYDWRKEVANEALVDLDEQYGVTTPIEDHIQELTSRYYRGLEVLQALDGPKTLDELAVDFDLDAAEVAERITYLEEFDRVSRDGETVIPVE